MMLAIYKELQNLAQDEFGDIILGVDFIGGTPSSPNKMRLKVIDGSYLDTWLSADGDYAYHWENRRQSGKLFRWDNAPHHPHVESFPDHFHDGEEARVIESSLRFDPDAALRQILEFVRVNL